MNRLLVAAVAWLVLGGCAGSRPDPARSEALAQSAASASTAPVPRLASEESVKHPAQRESSALDRALRAALDSPVRRGADRARDADRRAFEVLRFFGVRPGMEVLDLWSGGGYYTELLSLVVGRGGRVVAHNNAPYLRAAEAELAERFAPGRLANVERLVAENNRLALPEARFDMVLVINAWHDIYLDDRVAGWVPVDAQRLLAELRAALKPGGVLGIVDHAASPGTSPEAGIALHRVDPARVRREAIAAGFIPDGESDVLRNPLDNLDRSVFDPAVRGRTDQFVLRFRKPADTGAR